MIPEASPDPVRIPLLTGAEGKQGCVGATGQRLGLGTVLGKMGSCHRASPLVSWQTEWAAEGD